MVSTPSTFTDPTRLGTSPMIDFMVVLLPAPLRPTSVTNSPLRTSRSTPCRTCDSPYQACSFCRESRAVSGMLRPQVGRDHRLVLRHGGIVALGENLSARQDRDPVREAGDPPEGVLPHQHGAILRHPLDQGNDPIE